MDYSLLLKFINNTKVNFRPARGIKTGKKIQIKAINEMFPLNNQEDIKDGTEANGEKKSSVHRESCPEETRPHSKSLRGSPKVQNDILFPATPPTPTLSAQTTPTCVRLSP